MTEERTLTDVVAELERVFQNSGLECSDAVALRGTINTLAAVWVAQPSPPSRQVGRQEARQELDNLADALELPIRRIAVLSRTATRSLGGRRATVMARWLKGFAQEVRNAEIAEATRRGRAPNPRAAYAADLVIHAFEAITLRRIDLPSDARANSERPRGLEPLVRRVFQAIGIEGNAKAAIDAAIRERGKKGDVRTPFPMLAASRSIGGKELFERMKQAEAVEAKPFGRIMLSSSNH
jgi:hypothetical protein